MHYRGITLLILLMLYGCNQYSIVKPEEQNIKSLVIKPTTEWNQVPRIFSLAGLPTWTIDGMNLNSLSFVSEVKDSDTLFTSTKDKTYQKFESNMLPTEIVELIESSFALALDAKITSKGKLRPVKLGTDQGFHYNFEFVSSDNLTRKGYVAAAIKNEQLHLIFYQAPRLHYYDAYIKDVEYIVSTARIQ